MKSYISYGLVLFLVVGISCGILAYVNTITRPMIEENLRLEEENARKAVFPQAVRFEKAEAKNDYFEAYDEHDELLGYTFIAAGNGYSGTIQTMVGLNKDMTINRITILAQTETPGLGTNCTKPNFLAQYNNLSKNDLRVDKDGGNIASITGSTITTRTITNSIKNYIEKLKSEIERGGL